MRKGLFIAAVLAALAVSAAVVTRAWEFYDPEAPARRWIRLLKQGEVDAAIALRHRETLGRHSHDNERRRLTAIAESLRDGTSSIAIIDRQLDEESGIMAIVVEVTDAPGGGDEQVMFVRRSGVRWVFVRASQYPKPTRRLFDWVIGRHARPPAPPLPVRPPARPAAVAGPASRPGNSPTTRPSGR